MVSTDLGKLVQEMADGEAQLLPQRARACSSASATAWATRSASAVASRRRCTSAGLAAYRAVLDGKAGFFDRVALGLAREASCSRGSRRQIGENLEFLICGSAPLNEETQRWFQMLGIPVYQVYGLTETTGIVSLDEHG